MGKTATVLEAFRRLKAETSVRRMLVVAPLRVCQLVWRQEAAKWTQFRDMTFTLLHGSKKAKLLKEQTDIHLINPEGVAWLAHQYMGRRLPYDVVTIDELTKFKNHRAQRSKKLRKRLEGIHFRWGLTGTPAPNGYMDLFGQILLLDDGKTLGSAITYFRDLYFLQGFNGYDWDLRTGADKKIEAKIAPIVLRSAAEDYLEMPPLRDNPIHIQMPPAAQKQYEEMKKELIISLPEGIVTAANSGVVYAKLKQLTNGAVYYEDGMERKVAEVHTAKIDALKDLIEELAGQPLLVAYEFQHDLKRLRAALGKDTPALAGASEKRALELEAAWNRGDIPVLLVHPASVGHGLNLQAAAGSGVAHICWFSMPWDLELYDQTLRRIYRQGSKASHVINHILMVEGGMDLITYESLEGKDATQGKLLKALNAEVLRDDPAPTATGNVARTQEDSDMAKKLGFKSGDKGAPAPAKSAKKGWGAVGVTEEDDSDLPPTGDEEEEDEDEEQAPPKRKAAKGWGAVATQNEEDEEDEDEDGEKQQRSRIRSKIQAPDPEDEEEEEEDEEESVSRRVMSAFPKGVVEQLEGDEDGEDEEEGDEDGEDEEEGVDYQAPGEPEPPKKTRKSRKTKKDPKSANVEAAEPEKPRDGRYVSKAAEDRIESRKAQTAAILDDSTYAMATDRQSVASLHGPRRSEQLEAQYPELVRFHEKLNPLRVEFSLNAHGLSDEQLAGVLQGIIASLRTK